MRKRQIYLYSHQSKLRKKPNYISETPARLRKDWVGIASLVLALVAIAQAYYISRGLTRIEGFETLLKKYDKLLEANSAIINAERSQGEALHDLTQKNASIDSLISEQNRDLIKFRRLERLANSNKLSAALADIMDIFSEVGRSGSNKYSEENMYYYTTTLVGLFYRQVDNPFLLANDSAVNRWRKVHGSASNMLRLLKTANEAIAYIGPGGLETGDALGRRMKEKEYDELHDELLDMWIWFKEYVFKEKGIRSK